MTTYYRSWNAYPSVAAARVIRPTDRSRALPHSDSSLLPYGNGRSYGDVCLTQGLLLHTRGLDHFIEFDRYTGRLRCEAGLLLGEVLKLVVAQGWFLPVTPGTQWATLGGALANDVHGKNHHLAGNFGHHVRAFELVRSDGRYRCSSKENSDLFYATIGGLGLTGLITWIELQLRPISNPYLVGESVRFANLQEFFQLSQSSDRDYEYTVAWLDCAAQGKRLGRGLLMRANHAPAYLEHTPTPPRTWGVSVPYTPPFSLINSLSLRAFNQVYYHKQWADCAATCWHYQPFFYPLDGIANWNRLYGRRGFVQYQCVLPPVVAADALREQLQQIARSGLGSFLAVLKLFGEKPSVGLLSFPRAGATLALDFPLQGNKTFALLNNLDAITRQAGGAVYPAKDARMSAANFQAYYPQWTQLEHWRDPAINSHFWQRVTEAV